VNMRVVDQMRGACSATNGRGPVGLLFDMSYLCKVRQKPGVT
jgi:hypothetical protein